MYNNDHFAQPPPAHMGISPVTFDPKTGLARPMYHLPPPSQYMYPDPFSQMQWHPSSMYPVASTFRGAYPGSLHVNTGTLPRYSPPGIGLPGSPAMPPHHHHPGIAHPAIVTPGPKQEIHPQDHHRNSLLLHESHGGQPAASHQSPSSQQPPPPHHHHHHQGAVAGGGGGERPLSKAALKKKNHIKKPLNAFMLYMKEMRASVVAECTLKESAAINQILGRRWHALDRAEQSKYYDLARKERQLHMQLYPGWSARDNYAQSSKRKKRKRDKTQGDASDVVAGEENLKKCRARYGLDQQAQWCKPCQRKKKCIRYTGGDDSSEDASIQNGEDDIEDFGDCSVRSQDTMMTSPDSQTTDNDCCGAAAAAASAAAAAAAAELLRVDATSTSTGASTVAATEKVDPPLLAAATTERKVVGTETTTSSSPLSPHSSSLTSQEAMITSSTQMTPPVSVSVSASAT